MLSTLALLGYCTRSPTTSSFHFPLACPVCTWRNSTLSLARVGTLLAAEFEQPELHNPTAWLQALTAPSAWLEKGRDSRKGLHSNCTATCHLLAKSWWCCSTLQGFSCRPRGVQLSGQGICNTDACDSGCRNQCEAASMGAWLYGCNGSMRVMRGDGHGCIAAWLSWEHGYHPTRQLAWSHS